MESTGTEPGTGNGEATEVGSRADPGAPPGGATGGSLRRWGRAVAATAVATWLLVVLGGVVRITGSGMGCGPDWPLCHGQLVPLMDLPTFIEWSHRLVASLVGLCVVGLAGWAWWPGRAGGGGAGGHRGRVRRLAAWAAVLLVVQVLLGAVTVRLELPPSSVILHLGTAMALLGVLVVAAVEALGGHRARLPDGASRAGWMTAAAGFVVVLAGALVANLGAAPACQGFPLCNGSLFPAGPIGVQLHWGHRLLAYALVGWCLYLPSYVRSRRPGDPAARRTAVGAAGLAAAQLAVGAAMVLTHLPMALRALHMAAGAALFALLVALAALVARPPAPA